MTPSQAARIGKGGRFPPALKSSRKSRANSRAIEKGLLGNVVLSTAAEGAPEALKPVWWPPLGTVESPGGGLLCIETRRLENEDRRSFRSQSRYLLSEQAVPGRDWLGGGGRRKFEGASRGTSEGLGS